ncbi:MAG: ribose-phosphate pyrophosphokinase [Chlamydiae bacterium RIFCSPLOWO2_02_FULL_49_12]|nr:MAG: ribose-phosphate pyrophosphokinase [Chlamydiae bacterium RIFCSPLOWO2_02_FULL_49_12]
MKKNILIFSGSSHPDLARRVAEALDLSLGEVKIDRFPDGEIGIRILENVRGRDVFVVQSIAHYPNRYLMEMLIFVDALKRSSAKSITAVIPYFGYARQDRKNSERVPITSRLVADLLEKAGVTHVIALDLHADQVEGFFNIPVDHLHACAYLVEAAKRLNLNKAMVVAPDLGSVRMGRIFAKAYGAEFAVVEKKRIEAKSVQGIAVIGDVKGRDLLFVDDIYATGATLSAAATLCRKAGAERLFALVVHGLFCESATEESPIEKVIATNSVPLPLAMKGKKIEVVSVHTLFAKAIEAIAAGNSLSSLHGG